MRKYYLYLSVIISSLIFICAASSTEADKESNSSNVIINDSSKKLDYQGLIKTGFDNINTNISNEIKEIYLKLQTEIKKQRFDFLDHINAFETNINLKIDNIKKQIRNDVEILSNKLDENLPLDNTELIELINKANLEVDQINNNIVDKLEKINILTNQINKNNHIIIDAIKEKNNTSNELTKNIDNLLTNETNKIDSKIIKQTNELKKLVIQTQEHFIEQSQLLIRDVGEIKARQNLIKTNFEKSMEKITQKAISNTNTYLFLILILIISGLIGFIVWDRYSTILPFISRMKKIEKNLVINY